MDTHIKNGLSRIFFGKPIHNEEAHNQTIGKAVGLAVFASDALSSVAYATQEILLILAIAGVAAFHLSLPIAGVIILLLAILTMSYRQTIFAYPDGGGAYIVAKDNLGEGAAQTAGAALLMDYILTVAVSISSGTDQIVSVFPNLLPHQVTLCLGLIGFMMLMNLRGVKESGTAFAFPTYFFVIVSSCTVGIGLWKTFHGTLMPVEGVEMIKTTLQPLTMFLILRAFSSGCTALTGVEAISNGITAFKEPRSKNAANTMVFMGLILGFLFLGITYLSVHIHALPSESETIISQLGRAIYGKGLMYNLLMAGTTIILIMAANTSYADFPRLCALHAGDGFLPRQLTYKSGRLVFSWGIIFLSVSAGALIFIFNAHTSALIPLYAIGVFMSFTLSQVGMVVRWQKIGKKQAHEHELNGQEEAHHLKGWRFKQMINFIGALASGLVMAIFAITKFSSGAWVTVFLIPAMVWIFFRIHSHYKRVGKFLTLPWKKISVTSYPHMKTIILVDDVNTGTLRMIRFAKTLGHPWIALHVNFDHARAEEVQKKWNEIIGESELVFLYSPYRLLLEPVTEFLRKLKVEMPHGVVHIITGQLVVPGNFGHLLHSKNARGLYDELQKIESVIVTAVPYHLEKREKKAK
ncbi:MAG: APC family permease [Rhizobacter sp.]|nr:APC family permease [Bacteriovorax sp.]